MQQIKSDLVPLHGFVKKDGFEETDPPTRSTLSPI